MKIRLWDNESEDSIIYEGTLEEIKEQAKERISLPNWREGWSEVIEK